MSENIKPSPEEMEGLQGEANEFNKLVDSGELSKSDLQEKLIEKEMTPGDFLELLKAEKEGETLMYLLSRPGTCSHVTVERNKWERVKKTFKDGYGLEKVSEGPVAFSNGITKMPDRDPFISLHVALSNGITTMANSDWHFGAGSDIHFPPPVLETKPGVAGFILKPEFLKKIGPLDVQSFEEAETAVNSMNIDDNHLFRGLLNTYMARENVFNGRPVEIWGSSRTDEGNFGPHTIKANDGIRAATIDKKNHLMRAVPITSQDVAYMFEVDLLPDSLTKQSIKSDGRYWERVKIFHPDGSELTESEFAELQKLAHEDNPYKRHGEYFDDMNVMPTHVLRRRKSRSF